jgi:hypothetical protein
VVLLMEMETNCGITYGDGDRLWNLEDWPERKIKEYSTQNICNYRPQYIKQIALAYTVISLLSITNLSPLFLF